MLATHPEVKCADVSISTLTLNHARSQTSCSLVPRLERAPPSDMLITLTLRLADAIAQRW